MIDVIWPTTTEEGILRMELSSLIGAEPWRGTWESCALRSATFTCLGSVHFQVDDAGGARLAEMLNQEFVTRARGQPCPPNVAEFISHRSREYLKAVQKGNPRSELMWTPVVAGTFAWYCRKTLDLRVRLIGAREFTIARVRLDAMLDAYRKGGQDR
jgi:hypothetical protein